MRAVGFDLGETLIGYKGIPLSWKPLYRQALLGVAEVCECKVTEDMISRADFLLSKYNTRLNPRIEEVSADVILGEILLDWGLPKLHYCEVAQEAFFSYFQRESFVHEDAVPILKYLKGKGVKIGVFTDVPYGMSKDFASRDIYSFTQFVDVLLTSVEVGYRKPDARGFIELANKLEVNPFEMVFVGNEPKDIIGANEAGAIAVLIDREGHNQYFGEKVKITSLLDLRSFV
ncbi:putative HAD superfamily hydrolase [Desulfosporosinus orientis DSM 765]|uniref:Putative HAD superfamily hydrolase n=1 Tax=Desulfosporosinus orientis (strain ATCC 19365 / DSM 765 / NCIMB 8382 / VKM B-1628 / Singapore I) TaxID=768706 RepID=G7WA69_DESOD|nr:HAD family hydrolase [Desulfosporosinus orientis]AET66207.1 putative HAD superfamily hydrolase [Desulfosporosinus orientis DSM 765]